MNPFQPHSVCRRDSVTPTHIGRTNMDPNVFVYAQILAPGGSQPFLQVPQTFPTMGGSQPSTQDIDPEIETVPETQPVPVVDGSKRGKRSHKKKDPTATR
ncbi:hypothetical protein HanHA300_Chr07g0255331 [Helianthus annuus]|nr:hypothetical protein HanHA300_Chr07g0255331 [Helianthus annuus]KAJ0564247.1 hypothetical protein HanHA89_Chr07g0272131 [Helianthus annuus]KAJ0729572.1 hypothetical protein HanLR1_Chr07g0254401 [Helianthus annuus]KAJ0732311.1 hypothetical protein HanOQP8_Chr07g0261751 [Helianthus annuus]